MNNTTSMTFAMSLPRPRKYDASKGLRRNVQEQFGVRGESVVNGDEVRMKIRHMAPCSTCNSSRHSTSAPSTSTSVKLRTSTSKFESQFLQIVFLKSVYYTLDQKSWKTQFIKQFKTKITYNLWNSSCSKSICIFEGIRICPWN